MSAIKKKDKDTTRGKTINSGGGLRCAPYQLVFSKVIKQTQLYVTLRHVSNSQELAKIDPDTGLQCFGSA